MFATNETETATVTLINLFGILSQERRLAVVDYLTEEDAPVGLRELADAVKAHPAVDVTGDHNGVYASLYQDHLGVLAEAGIINKDWQSGPSKQGNHRIEPGPEFERVVAAVENSRTALKRATSTRLQRTVERFLPRRKRRGFLLSER